MVLNPVECLHLHMNHPSSRVFLFPPGSLNLGPTLGGYYRGGGLGNSLWNNFPKHGWDIPLYWAHLEKTLEKEKKTKVIGTSS